MIWGHRGASAYAPENTMGAFKLAYEMGADGIELDVHLTRDGHVVVAHDETVERCSNGFGRIIDMTLSELLALDFSKGFKQYTDVRIPTLVQVLEFLHSTTLMLNIEIKSGKVLYEGIEEKVLELVKNAGLEDRVIYSSFNHYSLMLLRDRNPSAKIGLLYSEVMVDPFVYAQHLGADAIHPYFAALKVPGTIIDCQQRGIKVHPWTVNEPDHMAWMFKEKVDAIITNYPDRAVNIRQQIQH